jgi:hypothetical protein
MATLATPLASQASEDQDGFDLKRALEESRADTRAVIEVIDAIGRESSTTGVLHSSLHSVKRAFLMDYGACWMIDKSIQATSFRMETNSLGAAYDRINETDHYEKGKGITGRTWAAADVIFVPFPPSPFRSSWRSRWPAFSFL